MAAGDNADLLRILISTDNHLGVWEKDEVRKNDSFRSFEEVLTIATEVNADFVLLGGDLFHENKPSRTTIVKAIEIMKKYCLNDRPVPFQILSDQATNFVSKRANFADPNLNVGLPVLTIHGNHDDPSGADNLSAVDILSSCSLVNYFGKVLISGGGNSPGRIDLSPILLQKGGTKLALYGLGNVRDERLARLFQTPGCVTWLQPQDAPGYPQSDWFNVCVLHQNRVQHGGAFAKNTLQESYLPQFLDLVIWGHEHECKPDVVGLGNVKAEMNAKSSYVIQPGSSVATALTEGESLRKHAVLLEVKGENWRCIKYPLSTVRPFLYEAVTLRDQAGVKPEEPESITAFLDKKVNDMIKRAAAEAPEAAGGDGAPLLPLIRLKVDYTGFSTINAQRFGQRFVGRVANPHDMLTWTKAQTRRARGDGDAASVAPDLVRPEALDQARIEDLIADHLREQLQILPEEELAQALHQFVEKDEKAALADCVRQALTETQAMTVKDPRAAGGGGLNPDDETQLLNTVSAVVQERRASVSTRLAAASGLGGLPSVGAGGATPATMQRGQASAAGEDDDLAYAGDDAPAASAPATGRPPRPAAGVRGGHGGARGGRGAAASQRQASLLETFARGGTQRAGAGGASQLVGTPGGDNDMIVDGEDTSGSVQATPAAGRGRGRGGRGARGGASSGRAAGSTTRGRKPAAPEPDDDIIEDDDDDDRMAARPGQWSTPAAQQPSPAAAADRRSARPVRAAAAGKKRMKLDWDDEAGIESSDSDGELAAAMGQDAEDDDDDDVDVEMEEEQDGSEESGGDDDEGVIEDSPPRRGGSKARGKAAAAAGSKAGGAKARGGAAAAAAGSKRGRGGAAVSQPSPSAAAAEEVDLIESDDDRSAPAARLPLRPSAATAAPAAAAAPAASGGTQATSGTQATAGGSRRALPSSLLQRGGGRGWGAAR